MGAVVDIDKMKVGRKGSGKHWTKEEVAKREAAAKKTKPKKKINLRMPDWLDEEAAKIWKKTTKDMKQYDILEKLDEDTLAAYCDAVARYKDATEKARGNMVTVNMQGTESVSAYVKAAQSYSRLILAYAEKLGLTANARARLAKKIAEEEVDPNGELFD